MNYIIIPATETQTAQERTEEFSRQLFRLSRPVPNEGDVTEFLFGFRTHPETKAVAMECDTEATIPVSTEADVTHLVVLINPTPEQAEEAASIANAIEAAKGSTITFGEIVPSWVTLRTKEELEAEGWFPPPPDLSNPNQA